MPISEEEFTDALPAVKKPDDTDYIGFDAITAHTSDSERPRALAIGYFPKLYKLVIVFRDNTWWQYDDVPVDHWRYLKGASSTGDALNAIGLNSWHSMGPADQTTMSPESIARLASLVSYAPRTQKRKPRLPK
jgi:hypothetical protein